MANAQVRRTSDKQVTVTTFTLHHVHAHVGNIMANAKWADGGRMTELPHPTASHSTPSIQLSPKTRHCHGRGITPPPLPSPPQVYHRLCSMAEEFHRAATTNRTDIVPRFFHSLQTLHAVIREYECLHPRIPLQAWISLCFLSILLKHLSNGTDVATP